MVSTHPLISLALWYLHGCFLQWEWSCAKRSANAEIVLCVLYLWDDFSVMVGYPGDVCMEREFGGDGIGVYIDLILFCVSDGAGVDIVYIELRISRMDHLFDSVPLRTSRPSNKPRIEERKCFIVTRILSLSLPP